MHTSSKGRYQFEELEVLSLLNPGFEVVKKVVVATCFSVVGMAVVMPEISDRA
jgi:hypothetical protein